GRFASNAKPEETQQFTTARISPGSELRNGRNVYLIEAVADTPPPWLRPGMEGVAKIRIGRRRVWWTVFHKLIDGLRMRLWL
ncbi:hypothetical protein LCGC14_2504950, partial [marine sediment metagenome]